MKLRISPTGKVTELPRTRQEQESEARMKKEAERQSDEQEKVAKQRTSGLARLKEAIEKGQAPSMATLVATLGFGEVPDQPAGSALVACGVQRANSEDWAANTSRAVKWQAKAFEAGGMIYTAPSEIKVARDGLYVCSWGLEWNADAKDWGVQLHVGMENRVRWWQSAGLASTGTRELLLKKDDACQLHIVTGTAFTTNKLSGAANTTWWSLRFLGAP
jgi:hypothetical protein